MRSMIALAAAIVFAAGCHNSGNGTPSPTKCDPSRDACPPNTPPNGTGTGTTTGTPTTAPTNQPPTTTPPTTTPPPPPVTSR